MKTLGQRPGRHRPHLLATSFAILVALAAFAPLRHHAWHSGLIACAAAAISIVSGLLYLRSTRGGAR